jgi:hypothetical protein
MATLRRLSAVVTEQEYNKVFRLVRGGAARSVAELVRLAVKDYVTKVGAGRLLNLREVPLQDARRAVERFLKSHPAAVWPDEMAEELGLDYRLVLEVVKDLLIEKKVEEASYRAEAIEA